MSVEERLERLERQNKWMRRLGAVGVALVAAVFLMGQEKEKEPKLADVIEAHSLVLRDKRGNKRFVARATAMGAELQLFAGESLIRVTLRRP